MKPWKLVAAMALTFGLTCPPLFAAAPASRPAAKPATRPAAKRVVFLFDASGSASGVFDEMKAEVVGAIRELPPGTLCTVLFCKEGDKVTTPQPTLAAGGPKAAETWSAWLNTQKPLGTDGFVAALPQVDRLKPDLVWFVSDGDYNDVEKEVAAVGAAAKRGRWQLRTVTAFAPMPDRWPNLARVAEAAGGACFGPDGKPLTVAAAEVEAEKPLKPDDGAPARGATTRPSVLREP